MGNGRIYVKFMKKAALLNASVRFGSLAFALGISTCKMHYMIVVQSLLMATK